MMKAKKIIFIAVICAILSGCGVAEDNLQNSLNVKGELNMILMESML